MKYGFQSMCLDIVGSIQVFHIRNGLVLYRYFKMDIVGLDMYFKMGCCWFILEMDIVFHIFQNGFHIAGSIQVFHIRSIFLTLDLLLFFFSLSMLIF